MANEPFFKRSTDRDAAYEPTDMARGPWSHESLHGHVLGGIMAHQIERAHGGDGFRPARLTVDMFRLATHGLVTITTSVARQGGRIRVVDAALEVDGIEQARCSAVLLRATTNPEGNVWSPPSWDVPPPEDFESQEHVWETRSISGGGRSAERNRVWMREVRELVEGEPMSPFVRAAMTADITNPLGNSGDHGLEFVNADYTLYMHREPIDEWIGVEVISHHSADGIAVATCALYDREGPIGRSSVAGIANRRD